MEKNREKYMRAAIREAKKAYALEEVPIGCVIVYQDKIIARGYNRRNTDKNTVAHAEMSAIKKANRRKHQPLNESVPLAEGRGDSEWDEPGTEEPGLVKGTMENNPEAVTLLREITEVLQAHNSGLFSDFEWQVWSERLKGYAYTEIAAHLGKPPKSIDNAMQRIRKKVMAYMEK